MTVFLARVTGFAGLAILVTCGALVVGLLQRQLYAAATIMFFFAAMGLAVCIGAERIVRDARAPRTGAAREPRLPPRAQPLPVPLACGELPFPLRWFKWALLVLVAVGCAALIAHAARLSLANDSLKSAAIAGGFALLMLAGLLGLLRLAFAASRNGGVIRTDPLGIHHCLLPTIPWRHVEGVDVQEVTVRRKKVRRLALAIAPAFAPTLAVPFWRRAFESVPVIDAQARLSIPLDFVAGEPLTIAGMVQTLADRHGAPRMPKWSGWQDPAQARREAAAARQREEADRRMQEVLAMANRRAAGGDLSPAEQQQLHAEMQAVTREMDSAFARQMETFPKPAELQSEFRKLMWKAALVLGGFVLMLLLIVLVEKP